MREASIRSRKSGEKNISANSVRKVTEVRRIRLVEFDSDISVISLTTLLFYREHCANSKASRAFTSVHFIVGVIAVTTSYWLIAVTGLCFWSARFWRNGVRSDYDDTQELSI